MLRSDLCGFSNAYILVTGNINVSKKRFTAANFEKPNNTNLMQLILIMQIIMLFV